VDNVDKYNFSINVQTEYLAAQSEPENERYVFAYHITINNVGEEPAQLLTRHWIITDGDEGVEEVHGDGVVGQQPHLKPGEQHRYTSGAILKTPVGTMSGSYQMRADDGTEFDANIPVFRLAIPGQLH